MLTGLLYTIPYGSSNFSTHEKQISHFWCIAFHIHKVISYLDLRGGCVGPLVSTLELNTCE